MIRIPSYNQDTGRYLEFLNNIWADSGRNLSKYYGILESYDGELIKSNGDIFVQFETEDGYIACLLKYS